MYDAFDLRSWTPIRGRPYEPVPYRPDRLSACESEARAARFRELADQRRSVRAFSADPVPERAVLDAIAAAATAPSAAHQQPWTIVLVTDPVIRRRIRAADETATHLTDAPFLIVVFQRHFDLAEPGRLADTSAGIAVGVLVTALHHAGLSTVVHAPSPPCLLAEVLGRPRTERAFAVLPVGYPADDCLVPDIDRKPLDEILVRV